MTATLAGLQSALAGRYTIERELGRGGMAVVYLARDTRHDRLVAIKVLTPDVAEGVKSERFLREIQLSATLTHPHILQLLDSGEANGALYYVMPYVAGESLRDRLRREHQLAVDEAIRITKDVAAALGYAHSHGVVHRDIKPENILLDATEALVADFGIARAVTVAGEAGGGGTLTKTGTSVGTPVYMSPEQAAGSERLDGRADLYSLGCVLYEMLSGHPPFTGQTTQEILARHVMDTVPSLKAARAAVPDALERALQKVLAKQPVDRFATAAQFADALTVDTDRPTGRPSVGRGVALAVGAIVVAGGAMFAARRAMHPRAGRVQDAAWARAVGIPEIRRLADEGNWDSAWSIARAASKVIPNDSTLGTLWPKIARRVSIEADPPSATVYRSPYAADSGWDSLGTTPLTGTWLPNLMSRLRFEKDGYETAEQGFIWGSLRSVGFSKEDASRIRIKLYRRGESPSGMVYVAGAEYTIGIAELAQVPAVQLNDYLIDKYEVTNRQFKQFVTAGGYRDRKYWQEPFLKDGRPLGWENAITLFVDRTGRPGPATWEGGDYGDGQEEYPVGGLSWYEATAYARFAGKSLPTVYHWERAAGSAATAWIVPRSNYGGQGPARVGTHADMSMFGAYDMAGNVREWCLNQSGDRRYILGGGWNEETYLFNRAVTESPWDRSPSNGVRLVKYANARDAALAARPIPLQRRDFYAEKPVGDQAFAIHRRVFDYDPTPLEATVDGTDSSDARWIKQQVSFRAAYGSERVPAFLFLPRGFKPPYQTVIYFPGSGPFYSRSSKEVLTSWFDFVVKSGRAVIYPVYKGTYERGDGLQSEIPGESNAYKEHVIMWAKDLRRAVDYAETRPDLDVRKLTYLGVSWGGRLAPVFLVIEPRIKVAVLPLAGLRPQRAQPEAEEFNYVGRVKIPVLVLSGRYDPIFPLDNSALPFFRLLGTDSAQKRQVVADGGHFIPRPVLIRETLDWLDRYVGPVKQLSPGR